MESVIVAHGESDNGKENYKISYTVKIDWSKLPDWAKFVTIDWDGTVCAHGAHPYSIDKYSSWFANDERTDDEKFLGQLRDLITNWETCFVEKPNNPQKEENRKMKKEDFIVAYGESGQIYRVKIDWDSKPDWVNFIAIDNDGQIRYYENEPEQLCLYDSWNIWGHGGQAESVAKLNERITNWRDTLIERPQTVSFDYDSLKFEFEYPWPEKTTVKIEYPIKDKPKYNVGERFVFKSGGSIYTIQEVMETDGGFYYKLSERNIYPESWFEDMVKVLS